MISDTNNFPASGTPFGPNENPIGESSIRGRIEMWWIAPLRRLNNQHDGFVVLALLFPLYEKHLRASRGMQGDFCDKHPIFKAIGKDLGCSQKVAERFWQSFRNGLLHKGMPKSGRFVMCREDRVVLEEDAHGRLKLNPWNIRDRLLQIVEADRKMWQDKDYPLAQEFTTL